MKLRMRITLWFTCITGIILLIFAGSMYYSASSTREKEFFNYLQNEAITKCNLLYSAGLEPTTLQKIYKSNRMLQIEAEVAVYDTSFSLLYHDDVNIDFVKETPELLKQILILGEVGFYQKDWQVIGLKHQISDQTYLITAAAYDRYGYAKLHSLLLTMIALSIPALVMIYISGIFLSKKALDPIKEITRRARRITATNLDLRLPDYHTRDELSELAQTFNEMLARLENSFEAQKAFVSNIAHELRTPLTSIIAELEYLLAKPRSPVELHRSLQSALTDARRLSRMSSSLLDLARASYDPSKIAFKNVRIDEVLLDARELLLNANAEYSVEISYNQNFTTEMVDVLTCRANEYLLKTAFLNLMENSCKYSPDHTCIVRISAESNSADKGTGHVLSIQFIDHGPGIPDDEVEKIFIPFYRGKNKHLSNGSGIGLSLTKKIVELHKGTISVESGDQGSTFTVKI
ncbi:MAG: ATP-binding protein [Thermaurantimonas sp.]|uniref:HAMP domain-containing sensor histidine kinase n=1 Tax=Thermaurantimonas sp. TaxID=2681568 RepID=UPI00391B3E04